jgi:hypothetical protein
MDNPRNPQERRKFIRIPFQKTIRYSVCYNKFNSEEVDGQTENVSEGGILFKTKWPPSMMSIISIDVDIKRLRDYIQSNNLSTGFNADNLYVKAGQIYGEVVRIKEYPESGYYDVAIKLIHRKENS